MRGGRGLAWVAGLVVAVGAAVATAHGLFEVAHAAGAPGPIAVLYPLITDGLALVAYATTARLHGPGRRYAWTVVVLAAGLSGLAQASYLAGGVQTAAAPAALRFGVGAWPAVAAAVVAHLLHLLTTAARPGPTALDPQVSTAVNGAGPPPASTARPAVQPSSEHPAAEASSPRRGLPPMGQPAPSNPPPGPASRARPDATTARRTSDPAESRSSASPARDRARSAAQRHQTRHGELPTVTALMTLAEVSRGTAGEALRELRARPGQLHLVHRDDDARTQP